MPSGPRKRARPAPPPPPSRTMPRFLRARRAYSCALNGLIGAAVRPSRPKPVEFSARSSASRPPPPPRVRAVIGAGSGPASARPSRPEEARDGSDSCSAVANAQVLGAPAVIHAHEGLPRWREGHALARVLGAQERQAAVRLDFALTLFAPPSYGSSGDRGAHRPTPPPPPRAPPPPVIAMVDPTAVGLERRRGVEGPISAKLAVLVKRLHDVATPMKPRARRRRAPNRHPTTLMRWERAPRRAHPRRAAPRGCVARSRHSACVILARGSHGLHRAQRRRVVAMRWDMGRELRSSQGLSVVRHRTALAATIAASLARQSSEPRARSLTRRGRAARDLAHLGVGRRAPCTRRCCATMIRRKTLLC